MATSSTYLQIQEQIAKLQLEAQKAREKEVGEVIARIKEAIDRYGLTALDLGLRKARSLNISKPKTPAKKSTVLYKDNETGLGWSGYGPKPKWLKEAIKAGKRLEDFKV